MRLHVAIDGVKHESSPEPLHPQPRQVLGESTEEGVPQRMALWAPDCLREGRSPEKSPVAFQVEWRTESCPRCIEAFLEKNSQHFKYSRTLDSVRASQQQQRWRSSMLYSFSKNEQVARIMMLSRLMSDCDQSGTGWHAISACLFATQPARPQFRHAVAGNPGSTGLRSGLFSNELGPYPLRT
jgi:hypothetical protein